MRIKILFDEDVVTVSQKVDTRWNIKTFEVMPEGYLDSSEGKVIPSKDFIQKIDDFLHGHPKLIENF